MNDHNVSSEIKFTFLQKNLHFYKKNPILLKFKQKIICMQLSWTYNSMMAKFWFDNFDFGKNN